MLLSVVAGVHALKCTMQETVAGPPSCGLLDSSTVVRDAEPPRLLLVLAELLSWGVAVAGVVVVGLQVSAVYCSGVNEGHPML